MPTAHVDVERVLQFKFIEMIVRDIMQRESQKKLKELKAQLEQVKNFNTNEIDWQDIWKTKRIIALVEEIKITNNVVESLL